MQSRRTSSAGSSVARAGSRALLLRWRVLAAPLGALRAASAACSATRTRRAPDEPADKLYNEGVFLLNKQAGLQGRGQEVRRGRAPAPLFGLGAQVADHGRPTPTTRRSDYDDSITAARRYVTLHPGSPDAAYAQFLIGSSLFRPDPRRHAATRAAPRRRSPRSKRCRANIRTPNTPQNAKRKIEVARDQLAGKEMDDRPLLPERARTSPARSTASRSW